MIEALMNFSRRKWMRAAGVVVLARRADAQQSAFRVAGQDVEIQVAEVSAHTVRLTVLPIHEGKTPSVPVDGSLVETSWDAPVAKLRSTHTAPIGAGDFRITVSLPLIAIKNAAGETVQLLKLDPTTGVVSFSTGVSPLLGLGEGGPQFDRRGSTDRMRSGQGGYKLRTHGGRVPIPWIIGTAGWAMFIHQPFGTFDFTGVECSFHPVSPAVALPLDIFLVASQEPTTILAEYARLTGLPEMPPLPTQFLFSITIRKTIGVLD